MVSRAKDTHTTNRVIRMGDEWDELAAVVGLRERAKLIRALIRWWLRKPGAKLPDRPSVDRLAEIAKARADAHPGESSAP